MRKVVKYLLALAGIGAAVGALYAYFSKKDCVDCEEVDLEFPEEEDFDLDSDLEPVTQREYVPLNQAKPSEETEEDTAVNNDCY